MVSCRALVLFHLSETLIIFSMKMSRKLKDNIVVICERTETEFHYLKELKSIVEERLPGRFSDIRVIPTPEELAVCVKRNQAIKKRSLKGGDSSGRYYTQEEELPEDYERYKQHPLVTSEKRNSISLRVHILKHGRFMILTIFLTMPKPVL